MSNNLKNDIDIEPSAVYPSKKHLRKALYKGIFVGFSLWIYFFLGLFVGNWHGKIINKKENHKQIEYKKKNKQQKRRKQYRTFQPRDRKKRQQVSRRQKKKKIKKSESRSLNCMKFKEITIRNKKTSVSKPFFVILDKTPGPWKSKTPWTEKHIKIFFQDPQVYTKLKKSAFYIKVNKGGSSINTLIYYEKKKEKTILKKQEIPFVEPNDAPKAYISYKQKQGCFTKSKN